MPQARRSSGSSSGGGSTSGRSQTRRSSSSRSGGSRSTSARSGGSRSTSSPTKRSSGTKRSTTTGGSADPRLEAAAQRLRKLNERIIEAGKEAGETTLTSYEKALKAIATTIERGPGKSDIDWISNLATAQAKFIRDVTEAWTSAARKALK